MWKAGSLWRSSVSPQSSQKADANSIEWAAASSYRGRLTQLDNLELLLTIDPPMQFDWLSVAV